MWGLLKLALQIPGKHDQPEGKTGIAFRTPSGPPCISEGSLRELGEKPHTIEGLSLRRSGDTRSAFGPAVGRI